MGFSELLFICTLIALCFYRLYILKRDNINLNSIKDMTRTSLKEDNKKHDTQSHSFIINLINRIELNNLMMFIVSITVLFSGLYIILSNQYENSEQKWAFGAIGSILGFWLRPPKK